MKTHNDLCTYFLNYNCHVKVGVHCNDSQRDLKLRPKFVVALFRFQLCSPEASTAFYRCLFPKESALLLFFVTIRLTGTEASARWCFTLGKILKYHTLPSSCRSLLLVIWWFYMKSLSLSHCIIRELRFWAPTGDFPHEKRLYVTDGQNHAVYNWLKSVPRLVLKM